jgi:hypothetical protein
MSDVYEIGADDLAALEGHIGSDADAIIGAIKAAQKSGSPARVSIRSSVSKTGMKRCWALPMDNINLAAGVGSTQVIRGTANRPCKPICLILDLSTPHLVGVTAITVQGQNQTLGAGTVPASVYAANSFQIPNNYDTLDTNGSVEVTLVNNTGAAIPLGAACFICEAVN